MLSASMLKISAQDYQTIYSDRIAYFISQENIHSVRIDSFETDNDSIFYLMKNIRQIDWDCFTPYGASWLGDKIIIKENGYNYFFNFNNDTIKINTKAKTNETWTVYYNEDIIVEGRITGIDYLEFLGLSDSIKYISFKVYDQDMQAIEHSLNNLPIRITKNFGLISTLNFYYFPHHQSEYSSNESVGIYGLIGLSEPLTGFQNITWFDVYDFQPGDEIHVRYEDSFSDAYSSSEETDLSTYYYLNRIDLNDTIFYTILRRENKFSMFINEFNNLSSSAYYEDTIVTTITQNAEFNHLPDEPVIKDDQLFTYTMINDAIPLKIMPSDYDILQVWGSCWTYPVIDECAPAYTYIKGLGGPYYSCDHVFGWGGIDRKLVYYKKGDVTWGNPLDLTTIENDDEEVKQIFNFYPHPAHDYIIIELLLNLPGAECEIIDSGGRSMIKRMITNSVTYIGISELKKGIYFLRISAKGRMLKTTKLAVQ